MIVLRTFSKIHGLAGLRIGYGSAAATTATTLRAHASSNDINMMAARAASAALDDREHVRATVNTIADERQEFLNQANARMLRSIDSLTNFVMLNTGRPSTQVIDHFAKYRILVAGPFAGFEKYVRVSLGHAPGDAGVLASLGSDARRSHAHVAHFKPSFLPAASSSIDSRMRRSRVSGRLAV